jgi:hypothetical protein
MTSSAETQSAPPSIFEDRLASGFYKTTAEKLRALGRNALAGATYGVDFFRNPEPRSRNKNFTNAAGGQYTTLVFGEIGDESVGTVLSAKGNHFMGNSTNVSPSLIPHLMKTEQRFISPNVLMMPQKSKSYLPFKLQQRLHRNWSMS